MSEIDKEKFDLNLGPEDLAPDGIDKEIMRAIGEIGQYMKPAPGDGRMRMLVTLRMYANRLRNALGLDTLDFKDWTMFGISNEITGLVMQYERSSRPKTPALDALCEEAMDALPKRARADGSPVEDFRSLRPDGVGEAAQRLKAMDEQAVAICELFLKYDMVCGGASILPNLEMLLMDFKKVCKKSAAMERALTELVDGLVAGSGHRDDPAIISALQEARTVLRKKDWR